MTSDPGITFVLTSCGRFDLLAATLASFRAANTAPIARWLVIEDSGDAAVRGVLDSIAPGIDLLVNAPRLGQMRSIDRAYATVTTPYIFHCEDDWRFFRPGFVEESLTLLERMPAISAVNYRRTGQNPAHDRLVAASAPRSEGGVAFSQPPPDAPGPWGGCSLNPGLRRLADYRRLGSFESCGSEREASLLYKRAGMTIAILEQPACETTGRERHVRDPFNANEPAPPGPSRNSPCPCGSGRRYKDCHGALRRG